jgi:hypothetical protein
MKSDKKKSKQIIDKSEKNQLLVKSEVERDKEIFSAVEEKMLALLKEKHSMTSLELGTAINKSMNHRFNDVLLWYIEGVQRDLEARKRIRRFFSSKREEITLSKV